MGRDLAIPAPVDNFMERLEGYDWATDFSTQAMGGGKYVVDLHLVLPPMPRGIAPEARDMGIDQSSVVMDSNTQRVTKFALRLPPLLPQNPSGRLHTAIEEMVEDSSPPADFEVELRKDRSPIDRDSIAQYTPHVFYEDMFGPHPRIAAVGRFTETLMEKYVTKASREGQVGMFWDEYVDGI